MSDCRACGGEGETFWGRCSRCDGSGIEDDGNSGSSSSSSSSDDYPMGSFARFVADQQGRD